MKITELIKLLEEALIRCGNKTVVFHHEERDEETEFSAWGTWDDKIIILHNENND